MWNLVSLTFSPTPQLFCCSDLDLRKGGFIQCSSFRNMFLLCPSIPGKSVETLGSQRSIDFIPSYYLHGGRDLPTAQCILPEAAVVFATNFLQKTVGGEKPGEETEGVGGRASCKDWMQITLRPPWPQVLPSGLSTSAHAASPFIISSP